MFGIEMGYCSTENIRLISEYIKIAVNEQLPGRKMQIVFDGIDHDPNSAIYLSTPQAFQLSVQGAGNKEMAALSDKFKKVLGKEAVAIKSEKELLIKCQVEELAEMAFAIKLNDPKNYKAAEKEFLEKKAIPKSPNPTRNPHYSVLTVTGSISKSSDARAISI
jgi:hypothetical protein